MSKNSFLPVPYAIAL